MFAWLHCLVVLVGSLLVIRFVACGFACLCSLLLFVGYFVRIAVDLVCYGS